MSGRQHHPAPHHHHMTGRRPPVRDAPGEAMSESRSKKVFIIRLVPILILAGLLAWCTSSNRTRNQNLPIAVELRELFMEQGLIDGANPNVDLVRAAKDAGQPALNRVLYEAAPSASLPTLKWLIDHGADPKNVGMLGDQTLLQMVAGRPQHERLEFFLNLGLDPLERSREQMTVLHYAARGGLDERALALLLSKGLSLNDTDGRGRTPMHVASVKSVRPLVAAGADINAADRDGRTPLHLAAKEGKPDVVAELLRNHASVFAQDRKGRTPLHLAATAPNPEAVVDALLAAGAPKATRDNDGLTPKELALEAREDRRYGYQSMIDKL